MRRTLGWPALTAGSVLVAALVPLLFNPRYYFVDDTESGAYGQWWEIGNRILSGNWSLINPEVWQSGNYLSEGAWGIFSPPLWITGLASHLFGDLVVFATLVKVLCLVVASLGIYALARTYRVAPQWAAAAGVIGTLGGFTLYFDAPSWVNGLMAWCLWPAAVAFTRRAVLGGRSLVPALITSGLVISYTYVSATLFLGLSLVAVLVEAMIRRRRAPIVTAALLTVGAGLFTVVVHLPGYLTAPVSGRSSAQVSNDGLLTVDFTDLAIGGVPVGSPHLTTFGDAFPGAPITYIVWALPLLAAVDFRKLWAALRAQPSLPLILLFALIGAMGASAIGPLRFPIRFMPYVCATTAVVLVLALSQCRAAVLTRRRLLAALGITLGAALLSAFQDPHFAVRLVLVQLVVAVLVAGVFFVWGGPALLPARSLRLPGMRRLAAVLPRVAVPLVLIVGTVVLLVPQHAVSPASPLRHYGLPSTVAGYQTQLTGSRDEVIVVGHVTRPRDFDEALVGNAWYLNGAAVQNAYSAVYFPPYQDATCMAYNGDTCGDLYRRLFSSDEATGEPLADLLGVNSVLVVKRSVQDESWRTVPTGWSVASDTAATRLVVRDSAIQGAGSVAWASSGVEVHEVSRDPMGSSFRVDSVPARGGEVALRLIPWPGYQASGGAAVANSVNGYLLTLDVSEVKVGDIVRVAFFAPGWQVELGAAVLWVLLVAASAILPVLRRRRSASALPAAPVAQPDRQLA
jgi:hypothetical protein